MGVMINVASTILVGAVTSIGGYFISKFGGDVAELLDYVLMTKRYGGTEED